MSALCLVCGEHFNIFEGDTLQHEDCPERPCGCGRTKLVLDGGWRWCVRCDAAGYGPNRPEL